MFSVTLISDDTLDARLRQAGETADTHPSHQGKRNWNSPTEEFDVAAAEKRRRLSAKFNDPSVTCKGRGLLSLGLKREESSDSEDDSDVSSPEEDDLEMEVYIHTHPFPKERHAFERIPDPGTHY